MDVEVVRSPTRRTRVAALPPTEPAVLPRRGGDARGPVRQTLGELPADARGHGHDGNLRVDADARGQDRSVGHVKVAHLVRFAVRLDDAAADVVAHARAAQRMEREALD